MSKENRKFTYDRLVSAGRFADISDDLKKEFGEPEKPKPKETKKKVS